MTDLKQILAGKGKVSKENGGLHLEGQAVDHPTHVGQIQLVTNDSFTEEFDDELGPEEDPQVSQMVAFPTTIMRKSKWSRCALSRIWSGEERFDFFRRR